MSKKLWSKRAEMTIWRIRVYALRAGNVRTHARKRIYVQSLLHVKIKREILSISETITPSDMPRLFRIQIVCSFHLQGGSNMTETNCDLFTHNQSRAYLNHLVRYLLSHYKSFFFHYFLLNSCKASVINLRQNFRFISFMSTLSVEIEGGSNMTGTICV
jgi:hypothetical protein